MEKVVYRDDMPVGAYIKIGNVILVGTGLNYKKGEVQHERLLS